MNDLLNPYQHRSVATVLRMFEEALNQAKAWLDGAEEGNVLYHRKLYLSEGKRQEARQKITLALAEIAALAEIFEMTARQENASWTVYSAMSLMRADLIDTTSEKLVRFGAVDSRLLAVLDPAIERLVELALEIARTFNE